MHLTNQTDLFDQEILLLVLAKGENFRCWCGMVEKREHVLLVGVALATKLNFHLFFSSISNDHFTPSMVADVQLCPRHFANRGGTCLLL